MQNEYKQLVEKDPASYKQFGEPENFYRILSPDEYKDIVNIKKVALGVETAENLLDWPRFRDQFIQDLLKHPNISVQTHTKVEQVEYTIDGNFLISTYNWKNKVNAVLTCKFACNSTYYNAEKINAELGFPMDSARTSRIKALAHVKLPESLKYKNSMFFCMGPHCMFSNLGDGTALMSYAPVTNILSDTNLSLPNWAKLLISSKSEELDIDEMQEFMPEVLDYLLGSKSKKKNASEQLPKELKSYLDNAKIRELDKQKVVDLYFAGKVRDGIVQYIPDMKHAEVIGAKFGVVQTKGTVELDEAKSEFHKRNYSGIEVKQLGWIVNSLMKLFYAPLNAKQVYELYKKHKKIIEYMDENSLRLFNSSDQKTKGVYRGYLRRQFFEAFQDCSIDDFKLEMDATAKTANKKLKLSEQIKSQAKSINKGLKIVPKEERGDIKLLATREKFIKNNYNPDILFAKFDSVVKSEPPHDGHSPPIHQF